MKHSVFAKIVTLALTLVLVLSLAACGKKSDSGVKILVPNDTTNEARALLLLQENGIITLKDGAGITATKNDIVDNPYHVEIVEAEAAQLPSLLADAEYAVINSNYAINAGLNPVKDSLLIEGSASAYANILAVKEGTENTDAVKALKAALESQQVVDYINQKYDGSVVSVVTNPTDGYDASVNYDALNGTTISIAASPTPHAEILNVAKEVLAEQGIDLEVVEFSDYVQPNLVTESGEVDANYFQHKPYLDNFNKEKGTHLVSVEGIHFEPFGLYPGKTKDLQKLQDGATVAVPNDATNEARALLLLQDAGLIKLKNPKDINATPKDVTSNPKNLKFKELEAAVVPTVIKDVDIAALNGNYAIQAGFDPTKDTLVTEKADGLAAKTYQNILVVKEGNENTAKTKELKKALKSDEVRDYINKNYKGAVVPVF